MPELYIVDIGASGGIHSRWKNRPVKVNAILFEPDPREYDRLKSSFGDNYIVLNSALSDSSEEIDFYLCRDQKSSSVYLPNIAILKRYYTDLGKFDIVKRVKITTDTLDDQVEIAKLVDVDFIKVDVQGHELPILKGGINTLKNVIGLEVEVEFLPVYKNQPLFSEVDGFLTNLGFELFDIKRTFRNRRDSRIFGDRKGQLLWGDALYFRAPESILSGSNVSGEKIIRAIHVYLAYNYPDLAKTIYRMAAKQGILPVEMSDTIEALLAAYKVEKMNILPSFRGKRRLHNFFIKLARSFSNKPRTDKKEDKDLGNPY